MAVEVSDHDLRQGRETNGSICLVSWQGLRATLAVLASFHVSGAGEIVPSSVVDVEEPDSVLISTYPRRKELVRVQGTSLCERIKP